MARKIKIIVAIAALLIPALVWANDAPHTNYPGYDIQCGSCHWTNSATTPPWTSISYSPSAADDTINNRRCWSCHTAGGMVGTLASTHSTSSTSSTKWAPQGWTTECVTCHNPHQQTQTRVYGSASYVYSGPPPVSIVAPTGGPSTIKLSANLPKTTNYFGYYLMPDKNYPFYYRIESDTTNNGNGTSDVTVKGQVYAAYVKTGGYAIVYGKNISENISYINPGNQPVGGTVKLFDSTGTYGPASGTTSTAVCMVCHTLTSHYSTTGDTSHHTGEVCTSCHTHTQGFRGACNACHGGTNGNITGAPYLAGDMVGVQNTSDAITGHTPGAHQKHIGDKSISCDVCHNANGMPTEDNIITVSFSGAAAGGSYQGKALSAPYSYNAGVTTGATESCSNVYCHSSGQSADGTTATPVYATPNWEDAATGACGTCHGTTTAATLGEISTGSHAKHLGSAVTIQCGDCHTDAGDGTVYNSASHVNKSIDVANTYSKGDVPGNGYGSCSSATGCHGSGTPTWGTDFTGKDPCTRCHGTPTAGVATDAQKAPPMATDQNAAADGTDPKVGAHQIHLDGTLNTYSAAVACTECHTVPASVQAAGHINDATPGVAEVPLAGTLVNTNPNLVPGSPSYAAGQCSNVYCHDSSRFKNGWTGGTGHTPTWSNAAYLGADKAVNCGTCHGNPPGAPHPNVAANACNGCHSNVNLAGDGFVDKTLHANGIVEATSGCTGCHGGSGGTTGDGAPRIATDMISTLPLGKHVTHVDSNGYVCDTCHSGHNMPNTIDSKITINFTGMAAGGSYDPPAPWQTTPSLKWTYIQTPVNSNQQCSNLYCHGSTLSGGIATTPTWNGTAACGDCHKTNFVYGDSATESVRSHATHAGTGQRTQGMACSDCHGANGAGGSGHVDGAIEWSLNTTKAGAGAQYKGAASGTVNNLAPSATYGQCTNVYCHSNVQPDGGVGAPDVYKTPTWAQNFIDCNNCHGGMFTDNHNSLQTMSTGSHTKHLQYPFELQGGATASPSFRCVACHSWNGGGVLSTSCSGMCHNSTPTKHANGAVDVTFAGNFSAGGAATYSGTPAPGDGYGSCSSTYCHSEGTAVATGTVQANTTVDWGTPGPLACDGCHTGGTATGPTYSSGGANKANSHNAHVVANGKKCVDCHSATVDASNAIINTTNHVNKAYDVAGAQITSYTFLADGGTCATACHGASTPKWGTTVACGDCHAVNNTLPPSHSTHYGIAANGSRALDTKVNDTVTGTYVFQCGSCHNNVPHADGNKDVAISATWGIGAGGSMDVTKTCSNVYCHSDGNGGAGAVNPQWAVTTMTCGSCHAAQPATARHTRHVDDATYNFRCYECHAVTATNAPDATVAINDKYQHVDKTKDVDWGSLNSGGTAYVNATTNCSNIYCHSDGRSTASPFGAPKVDVVWGTAYTTTCTSCHDNANASTTLSGAHKAHIVDGAATIGRNLGCEQCHSDTVSDSTTISNYANHVNRIKDIKVAIDGTACNNIKCHSNGNFDGTVTFNNPIFATDTLGCTGCHGSAGKAYPSYADGGAGTGASNSHNAHVGSSAVACGECHWATTTAGTSIDGTTPANHVDQTVEVTFKQGGTYNGVPNTGTNETCSTTYCHGTSASPAWGNVGATNCASCHGAGNTMPGSHGKHYDLAGPATSADRTPANNSTATNYVFTCGNCHSGTAHAGGTVSANQAAEVAFSGVGTYTPGGTSAGTDNGFSYTGGSCGTNACHQNGSGGAPNTTPTWGGSLATDCTGCHNNNAAATGKTMATGSHTAHVNNGTIMANKACNTCHTNTVDGTDRAIADKSKHANATVNVDINGTYDSDATPGNNYATGQCSNVYCHSDAKATPTYKTVAWGGAAISDCVSCHDNANASTTLSGAHKAHIVDGATTIGRNLGCEQCHNDTVSNSTTISNSANHVNKVKDIKVAIDGTACNNIKCHSNGNFDGTPVFNNPTFATGTLDCTGCHGSAGKAYPSYADGGIGTGASNSHNAHVGSSAVACGECHWATTTAGASIDGTTPANHVDQTVEVTFKQGGTYNGVPNTGTNETCSTTYCHGTSASPAWGNVGATNCASCHGASSAMPGRHGTHYDTTTVATSADRTPANNSTATNYAFTCGNCHSGTAHAGGKVSANQAAEVVFSGVGTYTAGALAGNDNGFNYTGGSCGTNACHQNGSGGAPNNTTYTWASLAGTLNCEGCHNYDKNATNKMNTGNHAEHINNDAVIGTSYGCQECHNATSATGTSITDKSKHADGTKEVSFAKGGSWTSPNCSTVYCHSSGQATPAYVNPPAWGSATALGCNGCHGTGNAYGAPDYASGLAGSATANSHPVHVTSAADCTKCHTDTVVAAGTAILAGSTLHTNQTRNVNLAASYDTNGGTNSDNYNGTNKTCSSISCHGTGTPQWGNNTTSDTCTKCHGTPTATVTTANRNVVAPPRNTAGSNGSATDAGQVNSDPKIGAHQTHLQYLNGLRSTALDTMDDRCQYCHGTLPTSGLHADGTSTPTFPGATNLATNNGAMTPSYVGTTCNNTYCHNPAGAGGTLATANVGTATAPSWTNAAYIANGTLQTLSNCEVCHKVPGDAGFSSTFDHTGITVGPGACTSCHGHSGDTTGIAGQRHLDGVKYGGGNCDSCHSYDVVGGTFNAGVWTVGTGTWGKSVTGSNAEGFGAHAKHIQHIKTILGIGAGGLTATGQTFGQGEPANICGTCHTNNVANHSMSGSTARTINFGDGTYRTGGATGFSFLFDPTAPGTNPPTYNGNSTTSSSVNPKSCSAVGCHFTTTPVWSAY